MSMKIALASCRNLPDWEVDDAPFEAALSSLGVEVVKPAWDDPEFSWETIAACVIRSTWDYSKRREEFVAWAERIATRTRLFNSARIVRWNTDKFYLRELEDAGIPTIPTIWLKRGESHDVTALVNHERWPRAFLKPAVGASASGTMRFNDDASGLALAQSHLDLLLTTGDAMLQPYYSSVETEGEYSAILIDGEITHCVRKIPVAGDYRVQDDYGARDEPATLDAADLRTARRAIEAVGEPLLYARADFLRDADGFLRMNELELVEPSLFFRHGAGAAETLAAALLKQLRA
jgi:glutathione synthase/RimK-type ligase-like ATP-grasp enzyme